MLGKLDKRVRDFVSSHTEQVKIATEYKNSPLINYLRFFQKQHRLITLLYKSLLFAFTGFILLLSALIISVISNDMMPVWGTISLGLIDAFLVAGIIKAFFELRQYQSKNEVITEQIHSYMKRDLNDLERIDDESLISPSRLATKRKTMPLRAEKKASALREQGSWDKKVCPHCDAVLELMDDECPICHRYLGEQYSN